MSDRNRGAMGLVLDADKLNAHMRALLTLIHGPSSDDYAMYSVEPSVLVQGHNKCAIVNGEGVGNESDNLVVQVPVNTATIWGATAVPMGREMLRSFATGEEVDLADFIRTFGGRLDSNHNIWWRFAGSPKAPYVHTGFEAGAL